MHYVATMGYSVPSIARNTVGGNAMARTRKTWPTETGEGRRLYPWAQWLDGSIWFLEAGKDYTCTTTAMRSQVGMRCAAAGLEYRTHRAADGSGLYIQTWPEL